MYMKPPTILQGYIDTIVWVSSVIRKTKEFPRINEMSSDSFYNFLTKFLDMNFIQIAMCGFLNFLRIKITDVFGGF